MLAPFDYNLEHPCIGNLVTIAKFDGVHPSIAMVTSGGKILLHMPYNSAADAASAAYSCVVHKQDIGWVNTSKKLCALSSGCLDPNSPNELLFIGSETNLLVYDVVQNSDIFDREITDGVNCLTFGKVNNMSEPVVIAGGNCSIVGLDLQGEEQFWTVTGDNVSAMEFVDWDEDGTQELVAGSEDFAIRVFKGEELIFDIKEAAIVQKLKRIQRNIFGFALKNGTYGVYQGRKRLWKQRQQGKVTAMVGMDFDLGDGQM